MKSTRRKFSTNFKTKVVLETLKEQSTLQELASKHELSITQLNTWKKEFLSKADIVFDSKKKDTKEIANQDNLYKKIGQLQVEIDFLKHVLAK
jgi:transposase-like protein